MDAEDVLTLQCVRVVAAQHVLVAQRIRKHRQERFAMHRIPESDDLLQQQAEAEELALVEHLAISVVTPAMKAGRLVPDRDFIVRNRQVRRRRQSLDGFCESGEISGAWRFEKAAFMRRLAVLAVVLDGPHAVTRWLREQLPLRKTETPVAPSALNLLPIRRALDEYAAAAASALERMLARRQRSALI